LNTGSLLIITLVHSGLFPVNNFSILCGSIHAVDRVNATLVVCHT